MSARHTIIGIGLAINLGCVPHTDPPAATAPPAPPPATVAKAPLPANPPLESVVATPPSTEPVVPVADSLPAAPTEAVPASQPPAEAPGAASAEKPAEKVAAKAGVGLQGQSLKEHSGVIVEAAKAYFNVRQRAVFEIQIPEALKLYEASEGRKPRTHDEFMAKVITANLIALPTLPQGDKYIYDPERGELMVQKRAR